MSLLFINESEISNNFLIIIIYIYILWFLRDIKNIIYEMLYLQYL